MEKNRSIKTIALIALVLAVVGITVAFAALSTTLTINGTAQMNPASWKVRFITTSLEKSTNGDATGTMPEISDTSIGTFEIVLTKPEDSVSYTFDVINEGSLNAIIGTLTKENTLQCEGTGDKDEEDANLVCGNLTYTLRYTDNGNDVDEGDLLSKGETRNITLTLTYDGDTLPNDVVKIDGLGITIIYVQE